MALTLHRKVRRVHIVYASELIAVLLVLRLSVARLFVRAAPSSVIRLIRSRLLPSLGVCTSMFLLTYSGCSAAALGGKQYRPATDLLELSLPELGWISLFGIVPILTLAAMPVTQRWRPWQNVTAVLSGSPFVFLSAFGLWANGCNQGCQHLGAPVISPDGHYVAHVEEMDGGAMDRFHTSVVMRSANHLHSDVVFTTSLWGPEAIQLNWTGPTELHITYAYSFSSDLTADHELSCRDMGLVRVKCDSVYAPPSQAPPTTKSPSPKQSGK